MRIFLQSYCLAINYFRSVSTHPKYALRGFARYCIRDIQRIFALGVFRYFSLIRVEVSCATAGIGFNDRAFGPLPWSIPTHFLTMRSINLPKHPLIEQINLHDCFGSESNSADVLLKLSQKSFSLAANPKKPNIIKSNSKIAVCLHMFYPDMWGELRSHLELISEPFDLFVTIPSFVCSGITEEIIRDFPGAYISFAQNRGRDVLPFLKLLKLGTFDQYDAVCKIHTKNSPHISDRNKWREELLDSLLGGKEPIENIIFKFRNDSSIGLLGPTSCVKSLNIPEHFGKNSKWVSRISNRLNLSLNDRNSYFFAGTMFWFRPESLSCLRKAEIEEHEFPVEMGQSDGTLAHAIERLIWAAVQNSGFSVHFIN